MKAPISWLREFVDIDVDVDTLCEKMVSIGFEIESKEYLGDRFKNVVVGKIVEMSKHPDADKLQVCKVDVGGSENLQIITAATNVFVNAKIPVALNNAVLHDGTVIKNGKLRGLISRGMFCGGDELGITNANYPGAEVDGVLILSDDENIGEDMIKVLALDDYVLDFSITFNRPDCNSIYGIAREVGIALGKKVKPIETSFEENSPNCTEKLVDVVIKDNDLCPNYYMQGVTDVKIAPSPLWISRRLFACGINSINNIVDITNYVLTELGQPMHAFDYDDIGDKTIVVRRAANDEKIIPLDKKEYNLNNTMLVIADKNKPVGLAGIMGGLNSGIKNETKSVMFESAKFIRENIRRTSRALSLRTDSSTRFEKGVDAYTARLALDRALYLVNKLDCGRVTKGRIIREKFADSQKIVSFNFDRIKNLLGIEVPEPTVKCILENLNITTKIVDDKVECTIPPYREDLVETCDIIEEIIRVYGYDKIHPTLLNDTKITVPVKNAHFEAIAKATQTLKALGFNQCVTYSFGGNQLYAKLVPSKKIDLSQNIKIINPLGEELSVLRTTISAHLLEVAAQNQSRKNFNLKLFEISKVFINEKPENNPISQLPKEVYKLCLVTSVGDFFDIKGAVNQMLNRFGLNAKYVRSRKETLHPGISADIMIGQETIGFVGELHPYVIANFGLTQKTFLCEINLDRVFDLSNNTVIYKPIPKLPAVDRDLAVIVDKSTAVQDIIDEIKNSAKLCESVELFDIYEGEQIAADKKSVAFSLAFRAPNRTLTDNDIEPQIAKILKSLEVKFGAKLR